MRTVVLIASTLALAVLAWAGSVDHRLVTAPKGSIFADALIGPLMLDVEIFPVRAASWPRRSPRPTHPLTV